MFDHLHPGSGGAAHGFGGVGMDGNLPPGIMGCGDRCGDLSLGIGGPAAFAGAPAIIAIKFYHVGPGADLAAHGAHQIGAIGFFGTLRHRPGVVLRCIAARRDKGAGGDDHAGAGNMAFIDGAFQPDIGIAGAFGAEIPHGGEARQQGGLGMHHGAGNTIGLAFLQHLIVPRHLVIGVKQQMAVAFDEAGQQGLAGQGDALGIGWGGKIRPHRHDAPIIDQHLPARVHRLPIPHPIGRYQHGRGHGRQWQQGKEGGEQVTDHGPSRLLRAAKVKSAWRNRCCPLSPVPEMARLGLACVGETF